MSEITKVPDPGTEPTIDVERAGRLLGVSRTSAYAAVHAGDIPHIRVGRRLRVPSAWVVAQLGAGSGAA